MVLFLRVIASAWWFPGVAAVADELLATCDQSTLGASIFNYSTLRQGGACLCAFNDLFLSSFVFQGSVV